MGTGIDAARAEAPEHAALMDNFKDQLLIALLNRLGGVGNDIAIPAKEVDDTGQYVVLMAVKSGIFHFEVRRKQ